MTYGRAEVLVTATGMETEMGRIAGLMNATKEKKTPLQISLDDFGKKLSIGIMIISAVESLGCVSVICSDKTGTLTQNKMTVNDVFIDGQVIRPDELDIRKRLHRYLLYKAILDNDSSINDGKGIGDPTDREILKREYLPRLSVQDFLNMVY